MKSRPEKTVYLVAIAFLTIALVLMPISTLAQRTLPPNHPLKEQESFIQEIPPAAVNKTDLTTPQKKGEVVATINTLETKERPDGGIDIKAGPPKNLKGTQSKVGDDIANAFKEFAAPVISSQKGKPVKVEIINDQTGKASKLQVTSADDARLKNELKNLAKVPDPIKGSICIPHPHISYHTHWSWFVPVIHIHYYTHWHCYW